MFLQARAFRRASRLYARPGAGRPFRTVRTATIELEVILRHLRSAPTVSSRWRPLTLNQHGALHRYFDRSLTPASGTAACRTKHCGCGNKVFRAEFTLIRLRPAPDDKLATPSRRPMIVVDHSADAGPEFQETRQCFETGHRTRLAPTTQTEGCKRRFFTPDKPLEVQHSCTSSRPRRYSNPAR
jgi:hypothetical protein